MSALAHTNIHHANIASVKLNSEPAVTSISVSARIDYIQRFSKQAVLVIDDDVEVYTQASRQFLISLSKEKADHEANVAFISASTKLNDIQMRCRLIEQLFASTLFDPEKSLAVSILQLSKQNKESITIVVEHVHALSLQIKYELCQLVDVANKTHNKINVVLFGQEEAAQQIAANKSIFNNKLAIIDAKSGQLFALDNAKFKSESTILTRKFGQKLIMAAVAVSALIGLSWYVLLEFDNFSLSELPLSTTAVIEQPSLSKKSGTNMLPMAVETTKQADTKDIHEALLGNVTLQANIEKKPAEATDILQALALSEITEPTPVVAERALPFTEETAVKKTTIERTSSVVEQNDQVNTLVNNELPIKLTPNYYLNSSIGYVVQIVGFSDLTLLSRFIEKYPNLQYFSYQKMLNEHAFIVLTTKVYESKEQARLELKLLPQDIIDRGVWIKALSTVKTEISDVI
jgi:DamX protein